jgi:hypothetical protein
MASFGWLSQFVTNKYDIYIRKLTERSGTPNSIDHSYRENSINQLLPSTAARHDLIKNLTCLPIALHHLDG